MINAFRISRNSRSKRKGVAGGSGRKKQQRLEIAMQQDGFG
jgi:hypothetical protein